MRARAQATSLNDGLPLALGDLLAPYGRDRRVTLRVRAEQGDRASMRLEVEDSGPGLTGRERRNIFAEHPELVKQLEKELKDCLATETEASKWGKTRRNRDRNGTNEKSGVRRLTPRLKQGYGNDDADDGQGSVH